MYKNKKIRNLSFRKSWNNLSLIGNFEHIIVSGFHFDICKMKKYKLDKYIFVKKFPTKNNKLNEFLENLDLDGLILSGGDNIGDDQKRDQTENKIINFGLSNKLPIFGVCRGMQIINEYFGGNVIANDNDNHVGKPHEIHIMDQRFSRLIEYENIKVNSFHNNIITKNDIGNKLQIFALALHDNTVEGYYHQDLPIIGVMWHPERDMISKHQTKLMKIFENKSLW